MLSQSVELIYLKLVLLGDPMVGKTSLRLRYMGEGFREQYLSTLGTDFSIQFYNNFRLQIWDLAGQENFKKVIKSYIKGSRGVMLVFDVANPDSIIGLDSWLDLFIEVNNELVPTVIVGNKIDLRTEETPGLTQKEISPYIDKLSKKYEMEFQYIETSALTGKNITSAFENLAEEIGSLQRI